MGILYTIPPIVYKVWVKNTISKSKKKEKNSTKTRKKR